MAQSSELVCDGCRTRFVGDYRRRYCSKKCKWKIKNHRKYLRNKEKTLLRNKQWKDRHPGWERERSRRRLRNPVTRIYHQEYAWKNSEKKTAKAKRWTLEHPERARANRKIGRSRRRASLRGALGKYTRTEWEELVTLWSGLCAYCGTGQDLEADHRIALSRGGSNSIENIIPACRACNKRKGARSELEFRALRLAMATVG